MFRSENLSGSSIFTCSLSIIVEYLCFKCEIFSGRPSFFSPLNGSFCPIAYNIIEMVEVESDKGCTFGVLCSHGHLEDVDFKKPPELGFQFCGVGVVGTSASLLSSSFPISEVGPVAPQDSAGGAACSERDY